MLVAARPAVDTRGRRSTTLNARYGRSSRAPHYAPRVANPVRALLLLAAVLLAGCAPAPTAGGAPGPASAPSAATPTAPPTPGPSRAAAVPASFTLVATGDVLVHQDRSLVAGAAAAGRRTGRGYDFTDVLAPVAPIIRSADVAVCHLETPLAPPDGPFRGYPSFSVQPQIVDTLAGAGYDTCSTASNHSLDAGFDGVVRTLDDLDAAGIRHTGTYRSAAEAQKPDPARRERHHGRPGRGHLRHQRRASARGQGLGRHRLRPVAPDVSGILTDAARARRAGADVVVASVHCCVEYVHDETSGAAHDRPRPARLSRRRPRARPSRARRAALRTHRRQMGRLRARQPPRPALRATA